MGFVVSWCLVKESVVHLYFLSLFCLVVKCRFERLRTSLTTFCVNLAKNIAADIGATDCRLLWKPTRYTVQSYSTSQHKTSQYISILFKECISSLANILLNAYQLINQSTAWFRGRRSGRHAPAKHVSAFMFSLCIDVRSSGVSHSKNKHCNSSKTH